MILLLVIAACTVGSFAACGLSTEGIPSADAGQKCIDDLSCAAPDLCKVGNCGSEGLCLFSARPDGEPPVQIPGDCKKVTCEAGEAKGEADPTDNDDGNLCTKDSCDGSTPTHEKLDGVQCGEKGVCKNGECAISCTAATDNCEEGNPCTKDSCDVTAGVCAHEPDHGKLVSNDDPLDCQELRCIQEVATSVPSDGEVPDDKNECTLDACKGGVPQHDPTPQGTGCGTNLAFKCNGAGKCVGCNVATDCPGDDTECHNRTCINEICDIANQPPGTPLGGQTPGDCQIVVCDGVGNPTSTADNSDVPLDEGNACTSDVCSGGSPSHPPVGLGTSCSVGGIVCNATGQCVACNEAGDCGAGPTCQVSVCSGNACTSDPIQNGMDPKNDCADTGLNTCGTDGFCNGAGACRFHGPGASCGPPAGCSGGYETYLDACDGAGTCVDGGGKSCGTFACGPTSCKTSCAGVSDCASSYACNSVTDQCVGLLGAMCGGASDCGSNICLDAACCSVSSCPTCKACAGPLGTCIANDPPYSADATCPSGKACNGDGGCAWPDGHSCSAGTDCIAGNCCSGGANPNKCFAPSGC